MRKLFALSTVIVVTAAACGASGSGGRLSHAQLVQRANAICDTIDKQLKALPQPTSVLDIGAYIKKAVPLEQTALVKMKKLKPSQSDESSFNLYVTQLQREVTLAQTELVPATQAPTNAKHVQFVLAKRTTMDKQGNSLANKLGFATCATPSA